MTAATSAMIPSEKRSATRFPYNFLVIHHADSSGGHAAQWGSKVRDIAPGGIGLLLPEALEVGTRLVVELPIFGGGVRGWEVRVIRVEAQDDGTWLHGCAAACGLTEEQLLDAILESVAAPANEGQDAGVSLDGVQEDRFVLFVRSDAGRDPAHPSAEQLVASCDTYEAARELQRKLGQAGTECVIRSVGPAGGGD